MSIFFNNLTIYYMYSNECILYYVFACRNILHLSIENIKSRNAFRLYHYYYGKMEMNVSKIINDSTRIV